MTFESLSMQRTLISFLGTNDYSETVYHWPGLGEYGTTHVAAALAGLWKATHIVVRATQAAVFPETLRLYAWHPSSPATRRVAAPRAYSTPSSFAARKPRQSFLRSH